MWTLSVIGGGGLNLPFCCVHDYEVMTDAILVSFSKMKHTLLSAMFVIFTISLFDTIQIQVRRST